MNDTKILSNSVKCNLCQDVIFSRYTHDYVTCECGNVSVDGGMDYLKRCCTIKDSYEDISIVWPTSLSEAITDVFKGATYTPFGLTCLVARTIRDSGYKLVKMEENK